VSNEHWSCDEKDKQHCRNAHGCHCKEIATINAQNDKLKADRDVWYDAAQTAIEKAMAFERDRDAARKLLSQ
jgi:hypothetical protein